jgi:transposase InsO family protein
LADTKWAYVSAITDEASKEVLAFQVSNSPNSKLIMDTLDELTENIPEGIKPIIHSDQGWHYQLNYYTDKLVLLQSLKIKYKVYNPSCS